MITLNLQKPVVFFLVLNLLFHGSIPTAAFNRIVLKDFANAIIVNCKNPDHSHPPMAPSGEEPVTEDFCVYHKDLPPLILQFYAFQSFQFPDEVIWTELFLISRFKERFQQARAPPLYKV